MQSAIFAADLLDRQFKGETVDWDAEFAVPLKRGVDSFRAFVTSWYDERFQSIIFHHTHLASVKSMITSILAGYAWDQSNPFVQDGERRINVLSEICRLG